MLGLWVCLQVGLPKTITLTLDPTPQHYIVENRSHQFAYHDTNTPYISIMFYYEAPNPMRRTAQIALG